MVRRKTKSILSVKLHNNDDHIIVNESLTTWNDTTKTAQEEIFRGSKLAWVATGWGCSTITASHCQWSFEWRITRCFIQWAQHFGCGWLCMCVGYRASKMYFLVLSVKRWWENLINSYWIWRKRRKPTISVKVSIYNVRVNRLYDVLAYSTCYIMNPLVPIKAQRKLNHILGKCMKSIEKMSPIQKLINNYE